MLGLLLYLSLAALLQAPGGDLELRYYKAWHTLEVERKPNRAAAEFTALLDEAGLDRPLEARCRLGLARCRQLLGRKREAEEMLRELIARFSDLPEVVRRANELLGTGPAGPTRFISEVRIVADDQFLDLDTGACFAATRPATGGAAELTLDEGRVVFLVGTRAADQPIRDAVPHGSNDPWLELETDEGRISWVQVLAAADVAVVRYVTRLAGPNDILQAPANPRCVGRGDAIEVWFDPAARFRSYRIERRRGPEGVFAAAGSVGKPPFTDRDVNPGERYGYRVTGVASTGDEGVPVTVQGTTASRGVTSGKVTLTNADREIDLLAGTVVAEGGDLRLRGFYGSLSALGFYDYRGGTVYAPAWQQGAALTVWDQLAVSRDGVRSTDWKHWQIDPLDAFEVPLRGGGVARCRWVPADEPAGASAADLLYEVYPDGGAFPPPPALAVTLGAGGATIEVSTRPGWEVREVRSESLLTAGDPRVLPVRDGKALDREAGADPVRVFLATAIDGRGRSSPAARAELVTLPPGTFTGEFRLGYHEGFSLECAAAVPLDRADVVFLDCAAEIAAVTLAAPGGIANLYRLDLLRDRDRTREWLFESIAEFDPGLLALAGQEDGDRRNAAEDVFVLRTRNGGFAKLAIVARDDTGFWTERKATVRYAVNCRAPVFYEPTDLTRVERGITFDLAQGCAGDLSLPVGEGFSFRTLRPAAKEEADLFLEDGEGEVNKVVAAGGITNVRTVLRSLKAHDREEVFASVKGVDPKALALGGEVNADRRFPTTDVLILKTRAGAWVKLVVHHRATRPDRSEVLRCRYVINEFGPRFERGDGDREVIGGVEFDRRW